MPQYDELRDFFPDEEAERLANNMNEGMTKGYLAGGSKAIKDIGVKGTFTAVDKASLAFFRNYSLMLATKETAATVTNMKSIIFRGLREGRDIPAISRQISMTGLTPYTTRTPADVAELRRMVRYRSNMIARTETLRASNMGRMYAYKAHKINRVRWMVGARPCPDCADYEGMTFPIDEAPVPPLHPNCTCTISAVVT